jgi:drug/metabolite transporter (DMT)-like permease
MVAIEPIGWKHLLGFALIVATIIIVVLRRDQIHSRLIIAIALMTLGSVLTGISSVFQFGFGFVDLELAALVSWGAASLLAMVVFHTERDSD